LERKRAAAAAAAAVCLCPAMVDAINRPQIHKLGKGCGRGEGHGESGLRMCNDGCPTGVQRGSSRLGGSAPPPLGC